MVNGAFGVGDKQSSAILHVFNYARLLLHNVTIEINKNNTNNNVFIFNAR